MAKPSHTAKKTAGHTGEGKLARGKVNIARQASLETLVRVFDGQSLSVVQAKRLDKLDDPRDRALANEIVNGVLRWRWQLAFFVSCLMNKPLKAKDIEVQLVLLMAIYELNECRTPDYAVINESVELVRRSKKKWAASLVNAVLRRFTREKNQLLAVQKSDSEYYSHPEWILHKIKQDWPQQWRKILDANNERPALWLRVNQLQSSSIQYQQILADDGIKAEPSGLSKQALKLSRGVDVQQLPGFSQGAVSVQDVGAQLAAELLNVSKDHRVLDLCAAPGGKTCHILESCDRLKQLVAVEKDPVRMRVVSENLKRLQLDSHEISLVIADACGYADDNNPWWQGEFFDRILIDAPCSASGVIRRHPDIKSLRRESDIAALVKLQSEILQAAWQMLSIGGELLYVTCSVFKDENEEQMTAFFNRYDDVAEIPISANWGEQCRYGRQLLPGEFDADGFYFCRLTKIAEEKSPVYA